DLGLAPQEGLAAGLELHETGEERVHGVLLPCPGPAAAACSFAETHASRTGRACAVAFPPPHVPPAPASNLQADAPHPPTPPTQASRGSPSGGPRPGAAADLDPGAHPSGAAAGLPEKGTPRGRSGRCHRAAGELGIPGRCALCPGSGAGPPARGAPGQPRRGGSPAPPWPLPLRGAGGDGTGGGGARGGPVGGGPVHSRAPWTPGCRGHEDAGARLPPAAEPGIFRGDGPASAPTGSAG